MLLRERIFILPSERFFMHPKYSEVLNLLKQILSSFLCITLLINVSSPALAQALSAKDRARVASFERAYQKQAEQTFIRESTNIRTPAMAVAEKELTEHFNDPLVQELMELRATFLPPDLIPEEKQEPKDEHAQFLSEYYAEVEGQARAAREELKKLEQQQRDLIETELAEAKKADVSDRVVKTWLETENAKIQQLVTATEAKIDAWQAKAVKEAENQYQKMQSALEAEWHKIIADKIDRLMELYHQNPIKAKPYLLEIGLIVLMTEGKNTTLFSEQEKELLHQLYLKDVKNGTKCETQPDNCSNALQGLSALGILGNSSVDSAAISEFIEAHLQSSFTVPALISGVSSLLAMKNYGAVRGLLETATRKEGDRALDIISFTGIVNSFIMMNGQYLGESSKWAQYPVSFPEGVKALGNSPAGNAWEEIAYMLAEDGSAPAIELLTDYGINLCTVYPKVSFKNEVGITCRAMYPFLVGALLSGKSGKYTGPKDINTETGYVMDQYGTHYISEETAARGRYLQKNNVDQMNAYADSIGLSIPEAIVRNLYLRDMGDLDANNQWFLDHKLFTFFNESTNGQQNIKESSRLLSYDIGSEEYKAKQRRQHRGKVWLIVGTVADIAILVRLAFDVVSLGVKAVNLGRAVYITTKMARSGVATASRVSVLWRMKAARALTKINRRLPARIKGGIAGSVQGLLPQFTQVEPLVKAPHGISVPTFAEAALGTAKFSAETGAFALDAKSISSALGDNASISKSINGLQQALNTATEKTNVRFASQRGWIRRIVGDRDFRYRQNLANEIREQGLGFMRQEDKARVFDFAAKIRKDPTIVVPQKVYDLKSTPLISKKGVVDPTAVRRIVGPLLDGTTSQGRLEIKQALDLAQENAGLAYVNRGFWSRLGNTLFAQNKSTYNDLLANSLMGLRENETVMASFNPLTKEKVLASLASSIRLNKNISIPANIGRYAGREYNAPKLSYKTLKSALFDPQGADKMLPIEFRVDLGVKGVEANRYQRVMLTQRNGTYFLGMSDGIGKPVDLSRFKLVVPTAGMPNLVRGTMEAGLAEPLTLKLNVYQNAKAFQRALEINGEIARTGTKVRSNRLGNLLANSRPQTKVFSQKIPVYLEAANGESVVVPLEVMADTRLKLNGSRFVLGTDNQLRLFQGDKLVNDKLFYFSLPKRQLNPFVKVASNAPLAEPLRLTVNTGRKKILPLYISTGLSLSSASVGLIAPLETTYKDRITDTDKTLISLAFPYLPSMLAPSLAPLVMRFGALRVVQTALATVAGGLAFTWAMGFNGQLDKAHLPPIWPLFISGAAIGVSSALSRSGLNILIDTMGGGGSLLQSMMFKNLGSVVLLAPSWIYTAIKLSAAPKITGKTLSKEELAKPSTDFSAAFPVLTLGTLAVLGYLTSARISPYIGRSAAVNAGQKTHFWREMARSWKTMGDWDVLPLSVAAFFFTGFEAAAFSKASSQSFRPFYESREFVKNSVPGNRSNLIAMLTGLSVAALPFTARFFAPKLLKSFSNPLKPAVEYKTMLALSYAMNATGGLLLMKYGMSSDPSARDMLLGIALMGLGTANVTQSLQKLANIKIGSGKAVTQLVKGLPPAVAAQRAKELKDITMTGFSWSQLGLAAVPLVQSSYVDREVAQGVSDGKGPLSSIWIPLGSLALSFAFASGSLGIKTSLPQLVRTWGAAKFVVDGPASFNPLPLINSFQEEREEGRYGRFDFKIKRYQEHQKDIEEAAREREQADIVSEEKKESLLAHPLPSLTDIQANLAAHSPAPGLAQ